MGDLLRFDAERLRMLVERHLLYTGSARARELLDDWDNALSCFVKVMPLDFRRALLELRAERQAAESRRRRLRIIRWASQPDSSRSSGTIAAMTSPTCGAGRGRSSSSRCRSRS